MQLLQTPVLLIVSVVFGGGHTAIAAEPASLPPALVANWSRALATQANPADKDHVFAWEGALPGSWKDSLTDRLSPLSTPASLLGALGSSPVTPPDLALGLLATTDVTKTAAILLDLSARQWVSSAAERTLVATLGPLKRQHEAKAALPALLVDAPAAEAANAPPSTFMLEPIRLSSEGKQ